MLAKQTVVIANYGNIIPDRKVSFLQYLINAPLRSDWHHIESHAQLMHYGTFVTYLY